MPANTAVTVKNLQKSFGKIEVLKKVSFSVPRGQILALLGPNGAGKTTTIRMLSTLLLPDTGTISVAGFDPVKQGAQVRASIGLTGQFAAVDEYLTGRENVVLIGRLYHLSKREATSRAAKLLETFDLIKAADRPAKTYSGGMKRRLDLAMSLVASPPILFLDEPTTGLDPHSRIGLWQHIKGLAKDGTTILLTTQYMEEAEYLADNVIVLDHGKIIAEGTVNELKARAGTERVEILLKNPKQLEKAMQVLGKEAELNQENSTLTVPAKKGVSSLTGVLNSLSDASIIVDTAALRRPTLDEVFLALTGHDTSEKKTKKGGAK